jgi:hypothetical protein
VTLIHDGNNCRISILIDIHEDNFINIIIIIVVVNCSLSRVTKFLNNTIIIINEIVANFFFFFFVLIIMSVRPDK